MGADETPLKTATGSLELTHHDDLRARVQGHLVGHRARADAVDEDARVVPTDDAHLLQQRVPLEGQHRDLARELPGRPPPHGGAAAERGDGARVQPGSAPRPSILEFSTLCPAMITPSKRLSPAISPHSATCWPGHTPLTWLSRRGPWRPAVGRAQTLGGLGRSKGSDPSPASLTPHATSVPSAPSAEADLLVLLLPPA